MFCKHNWQVLNETTTKSKLELVQENNSSFNSKNADILTCTKCGKLERFVENI